MKKKSAVAALIGLTVLMSMSSCENDNINPYELTGSTEETENQGSREVLMTQLAEYPIGSLVWTHDTTLNESVEIPEGTSLYIEQGVTVTCAADAKVPVELVVLGNLYCLGTVENPVTFTSDKKEPAAWGGIICGYNSGEVVLNHVDIAYAGATPTESSISFQNKLFKTEIDGGVPAFHFCNPSGKFVIANSYFHNNYNDQTYFTGGYGVITGNVFADSGNAADGGEAINVKSGCRLDIAYNLIYNACTNAFKLSNAGTSEVMPSTEIRVFNNTMVNCGWRRSKNKKGGSIWLEKGIYPKFVNNLVYDCRYGMKQPKADGADVSKSIVTPNYYFSSTSTGVEQTGPSADLIMYYESDPRSKTAGDMNPAFVNFAQNPKMNINCEVDEIAKGAPLAYSKDWDFHLQAGSPALSGGAGSIDRLFPNGLPFYGIKKVNYIDTANDQNYYFTAPALSVFYGAFGTL